jgi:imidazolonepropionase-like amidohydrolase
MRTLVLVVAVLALAGATARVQTPDVKVITGATLINPTGTPVPNSVIVVTGSHISSVGRVPPEPRATGGGPVDNGSAGAEVIDGRGKFVIPGLADMHNHLEDGSLNFQQNRVANLGRLLAAGITTVFDPNVPEGDFTKLKAAAATDASRYPRFFGTGPSITVEGDTLGSQSPKPKTPDEARTVVQRLKALNVDALKIARDDLAWASTRAMALMPADVLQAAVAEAHRLQLKVYVHAPQLARAKETLRAGVDGLLHGIIDEPIDPDFIELMKKNGALYVPTLGMFEDVADVSAFAKRQAPHWDSLGLQPSAIYQSYIGGQGAQLFRTLLNNSASAREHLPVLRANLKNVFDAGIPIVMGTDTGFFGVLLGVATPIEMELMVDAGLTPADVIRSATIDAARMIGRDKEQGSIEAGKVADLLILDGNPLEDITAVRRIYRVVKGGIVYDPARLSK